MITLPIVGSRRKVELSPSKIIGVAFNYTDHAAEKPSLFLKASKVTGAPPAKNPVIFIKPPSVLIGHGGTIVLPHRLLAQEGIAAPRCDYEAELAVVIGRKCKNVSISAALEYVRGYSCFNDVTQRDLQNIDQSGWFRGKGFDTFGPLGPALLPENLTGKLRDFSIICRLNGVQVQCGNTSSMIFGIAELVSFISTCMTLEEDDIIATGTPSGVGPMVAGDVVEVEIEGIGILKNLVAAD